MVLATQCPFCQTTFRVAQDQLTLRDGLVRCGSCKEVFDGNAHLLPPEPEEQLAAVSSPQSSPQSVPDKPSIGTAAGATPPAWITANLANTFANVAAATNDAPWGVASDEVAEPNSVTSAEAASIVGASNKLAEIKPLENDLGAQPERDIAAGLRQETTASSSLEMQDQDAADDNDEAAPDDEDLPAFVQHAERRERLQEIFRIVMSVGIVLLSIMLLLQAIYGWRNQLVAWLPATQPPLAAMCKVLHCTVGLPSNIEQLSLDSSELQQLPSNANIYTLSVLLRNRSHTTQSWPYLELTLNDGDDKPIIRRVFTPSEYLPLSLQEGDGFSGDSEQAIKLSFESTQPAAAGYRVYLFFP